MDLWCSYLLILVLLVFVCVQGQNPNSNGFINIDCGVTSNTSYVDSFTGLTYVSDDQYIDTGLNDKVSSYYTPYKEYQDLETLRKFPNGTKNCYTLTPVTEGLKYLVRATFYYGNYDGLEKNPSFDLYFGVNFWFTVSISRPDYFYAPKIIAIAPANCIQVCLVNKGLGTPFISALELRPLSSTLYELANATQSLNLSSRVDMGSNNSLESLLLVASRYPDDEHDRLWYSYTESSWNSISTGSVIDGFTFEVPSRVLQTAAVPSIENNSIDITWSTPNRSTIFFVVLHFAEIQIVQNTSLREFDVYANGEQADKDPVPLKYLTAGFVSYTTTFLTNYNVSLKSSTRATLPPILNAYELYTILPVTMLPTDATDAATIAKEALTTLKTAFQGSSRVVAIKRQILHGDLLHMKIEESMQIFLVKSHDRCHPNSSIWRQHLRANHGGKGAEKCSTKFDHMVAGIEESNNLSTYSFDELMGSLQTHEAKFRSKEKGDERAFYRKGESSQGRGGRGHCRFGEFEFQHDKKMSSSSSRTDMAVCKPIVSENKGKNSKHAVKKKRKSNSCFSWRVQKVEDDMIYMSTNEKLLTEFRASMKKEFEMTDFGLLHYFLGLEVEQEHGSVFVSQRKYANDLLKNGMHSCKAATTPMNNNEKLTRDDGTGFCDETKFRGLVGGLIYLTHTRRDISYAVGVISSYMHNPTKHHFGAAKRVLKYISGKTDCRAEICQFRKSESRCFNQGIITSKFENMRKEIGINTSTHLHLMSLINYLIFVDPRTFGTGNSSHVLDDPNNPSESGTGGDGLNFNKKVFSFSELKLITNDFREKIGSGGFGEVFKGRLGDGNEAAVKVCSESSTQGTQQFLNEVEKLSRVHHKNLVSLLGYCKDGNYIALIYEYMQEGNLQNWIRGNAQPLSWKQRLRIAYESAQGLEYLHKMCNPPLIHRDIKTSNILLTRNLEAKVSDFGLVRAFSGTHVSTKIVGTPGYLDPYYASTSQLIEKSDVYSFGVVLLEMVTGKTPILQGPQKTHLAQFVQQRLSQGNIESILDPFMGGQYKLNSIWKVAELALKCTDLRAKRPDMTAVVTELKESMDLEMSSFEIVSVALGSIREHSGNFEMAQIGGSGLPDHGPLAR
ncbi:putative LRR receptor-like serine/threonine-protein kinase At1g51820 [Carex rostrata]